MDIFISTLLETRLTIKYYKITSKNLLTLNRQRGRKGKREGEGREKGGREGGERREELNIRELTSIKTFWLQTRYTHQISYI